MAGLTRAEAEHSDGRPAAPGRSLTGLTVGILMLDTKFHRPPGDIGNIGTWSVPVQFALMRGISEKRAVEDADPDALPIILQAANSLVELGVRGITTSCGFLALFQKELQLALPVPVATSSLLQAQMVQALLPAGKRVGILTFSAESLGRKHLAAAGVPADTPIEGMPADSLFRQVYGGRGGRPDRSVMEREMCDAAMRLVERHPDVGAIVCECTNMPPFSRAVSERTGRPVHDIVGFVEWFARGLAPTDYSRSR